MLGISSVRRVGDKVSVILAKGPTEHISSVKSFSFEFLVFAFNYFVFRHVCSLGGLFSHPCLGQLATVVMSAIHFRHRVILARHCIPSPAHESRLAPGCAHRVLHTLVQSSKERDLEQCLHILAEGEQIVSSDADFRKSPPVPICKLPNQITSVLSIALLCAIFEWSLCGHYIAIITN